MLILGLVYYWVLDGLTTVPPQTELQTKLRYFVHIPAVAAIASRYRLSSASFLDTSPLVFEIAMINGRCVVDDSRSFTLTPHSIILQHLSSVRLLEGYVSGIPL